MVGISSPGIGSGLDISTIVDSLVAADIQPARNRLLFKESTINAEISAIGQVKGALSEFQSVLSGLMDISQFQKRVASQNNEDYFTATAEDIASESSYSVEVSQLAQSHSIASNNFASSTAQIGTGTLQFEFGTYNGDQSIFTNNPNKSLQSVNISGGTLIEIRDSVNSADIGVTASIINDGSGERLIFTSEDTGAENALKVTVIDDDANNLDTNGLSQLVYDPADAAVSNLSQLVGAQNAEIEINGLAISSANNTIDSAIEGVTLNLKKAEIGAITQLSIGLDKDGVKEKVNGFVEQYNATMNTLKALSRYDEATEQSAILSGDATVRNLKSQLSNIISQQVSGLTGPFKSLVDLGLKTDAFTGTLSLDSATLDDALENDFDAIGQLFAKGAIADDPLIRVNSTDDNIEEGAYNVNLTTLDLGVNLSGTIGGLASNSSDGRILFATDSLSGLSIEVLGGSTGSRGDITVFEGVGFKLNQLIDEYLSGDNSILGSKETILNERIDGLQQRQDDLDRREVVLEARYLRQFSALDSLLAQLQSTSTFLSQQLASLPPPNQINNN